MLPSQTTTQGCIDLRVRASRISLLYRQSSQAGIYGLLASVALCVLLAPVVPADYLIAWFLLVCASTLARFALFRNFHRAAPADLELLDWERPYISTLLTTAISWGTGVAILVPASSALHLSVGMTFLLGMAGSAIALFTAHRTLLLLTQACLLLPATLRLLWIGESWGIALAVGILIFFLASMRSSRVLNDELTATFQLGFELQEAKEAAERLARTDPLTGISNRRAFEEDGHLLASTCARHGRPLAAVVVDLDHFKLVNDSLGHAAGDAALCHVADLLRHHLRQSDVLGRLGGEEFGVFLSAGPEEACELAEKLRRVIFRSPAPHDGNWIPLSASFGVASGSDGPEALLHAADAALYRAKGAGRNCVVCQRCSSFHPAGEGPRMLCHRVSAI